MKLIISYYLKEEPNLILFEELDNIELDDGFSRFINLEDYLNNKDNLIRNDLYSLKLEILINYYGDNYRNEIIYNQELNERFFEEKFVYNYTVI